MADKTARGVHTAEQSGPWGYRMNAPESQYWSVEECRWVRLPAREVLSGEMLVEVPDQRDGEPAKEPVEA